MSELKVYHCNEWHNEYTEFYIKSEADKVIAELEKKLDIYKRGWMENDRVNANQYAEIRHHKYKRCLAMADKCAEAYKRECGLNPEEMTDKEFYKQQIEFWPRWNSKWLKIGEKFKTCSNEMDVYRGKFPICDDCLKVLREIIKERRLEKEMK